MANKKFTTYLVDNDYSVSIPSSLKKKNVEPERFSLVFNKTNTKCSDDVAHWGVLIGEDTKEPSVCIYSQLKRCSSSEVASMIKGVLRHCTEMSVEKQYVDTHGQSEVAFAFSHLLGFNLMPRLKNISKQKLYIPDVGMAENYKHLIPALTRPINWELIAQQYDQIVQYTHSIKAGYS